jgi:5-methylthioadenosine/S-adenosylhomocysteine deaminase
MAKIIIENGTVLTVDRENTIYKTGYVVVENDLISAVGKGQPGAELRAGADRIIDASLMAVMPGMVNGHTHLFQSFIRGLADDKPLLQWLQTAIWPVAQAMDGENAEMAARLGLIENIRGGATSVVDHQYVHTHPEVDDGVFTAAEDTGLRFRHAYGWADMNYHPSLQLEADYLIGEMERLHAAWHGKASGRLSFEPAPVIPWGCTDDTMRRNWELVKRWGVGMHIHVAETQEEIDMNLKDRGNRHIEWLADLGMLGPELQLVHSVWFADNELELTAKSGATVVHCPVSNMYLASGAARIPEMKKMGIPVALATDGPGSNNNQDMMEVLKTTALLAKFSTLDAMALLPDDVIGFACRGGSHAMGMPDAIGSLEVGKKADIILIDLDTPFAMPVHHANSAIVYNLSSAAVDTVMVDGKILLEGKEFVNLDEKKLLADARQSCGKLFDRAGVKL